MSPNGGRARDDTPATSEAPPLVTVVNNDLYVADHAYVEVRKYDKQNKARATIGRLPERTTSMNDWGLSIG
uniref:Putative ovule protein n=1 Tax=Solanum chacoense TaxID=4108 RepID=A0A0V0GQ54_SOLCH